MAASPLLLPLLSEISDPARKTGLTSKTLRDFDLDAAIEKKQKKKKADPELTQEYGTLLELLKGMSNGELKGMAAKVAAKSVSSFIPSQVSHLPNRSFLSFFFFFF